MLWKGGGGWPVLQFKSREIYTFLPLPLALLKTEDLLSFLIREMFKPIVLSSVEEHDAYFFYLLLCM